MTRPSGDAAHVSADVELTEGAALTFADRNGMGIFAYSRTNGSYYFDEVVAMAASAVGRVGRAVRTCRTCG